MFQTDRSKALGRGSKQRLCCLTQNLANKNTCQPKLHKHTLHTKSLLSVTVKEVHLYLPFRQLSIEKGLIHFHVHHYHGKEKIKQTVVSLSYTVLLRLLLYKMTSSPYWFLGFCLTNAHFVSHFVFESQSCQ